jgi:hypothetical protein
MEEILVFTYILRLFHRWTMGRLLVTFFFMLEPLVMVINGGEHQLHFKINPCKTQYHMT